jgi:putative flippase GtrA
MVALHDRERLHREAARYVAVGVSGYAVQLGSYTVLVHAVGMPYLLAGVVAGLLALANNFLLHRHWTFGVADGAIGRQMTSYLVISAVFFALQLVVLHVLVTAGASEVVAEALAVAAIVPPNFVAQRHFAFRRHASSPSEAPVA